VLGPQGLKAQTTNSLQIIGLEKNGIAKMAKGVKHFLRNGKEYTGPTHKMKDGTLHTGAKHTSSSRKLYHKDDLPKTKK